MFLKIIAQRGILAFFLATAAIYTEGFSALPYKGTMKNSPNTPPPKFEGKSVLITGSSSGIGAAICFEVARRGACRVVMISRDRDGMERVRERIVNEVRSGQGGKCGGAQRLQ